MRIRNVNRNSNSNSNAKLKLRLRFKKLQQIVMFMFVSCLWPNAVCGGLSETRFVGSWVAQARPIPPQFI